MKPTDSGYAPVPGHLTAQVRDRPELHAPRFPSSSITEYEPLLDSANARPADWLRIARDIVEHRHHYDGFVVLHGTDTMAYTASALAFLLRGLGKPVVVTGSQIPLGVLRSDGRQNLLTSVLVAARDDVKEVCLVFGSQILRGCARGQGQRERLRGLRVAQPPAARPGGRARSRSTRRGCATPEPGAVGLPMTLDAPGRAAAAVPRHARRAAARGDGRADAGPRARGLRRRHRSRRRPLAAGERSPRARAASWSPSSASASTAASTSAPTRPAAPLIAAGAVGGLDMTTEAAYAKLVVLLSEGRAPDEVRALMAQDLAGELTT